MKNTIRRKRLVLAVSFALVALMISSAASAYVLLNPPRRWFNAETPRNVRVDNGGMSSVTGNDPDHGVTAAVNAVKEWNGSGVNVTTAGSANVRYQLGDGISDLIFADPLHICTGSCIAATTTGYYNTGSTGTCGGLSVVEITDSDVAFNLRFDYATVAQGSCSGEIYLESVTTHEIGHLIGLGHSSNSSALMAPTIAYCDNKGLAGDDINGRNALYNCTLNEGGGGGGCTLKQAGESCSSNSECCSNSCKGKPGRKTCK